MSKRRFKIKTLKALMIQSRIPKRKAKTNSLTIHLLMTKQMIVVHLLLASRLSHSYCYKTNHLKNLDLTKEKARR